MNRPIRRVAFVTMIMFALYGAMIEAVCVAVAAIVASYGARA